MFFLYVKALHIIFVVTWFAALFYMPRLFVYFAEANLKNQTEKQILQTQLLVMQKRLWYGISWPSLVLTMLWGGILLYHYSSIPAWMYWKLAFVFFLVLYHLSCEYILRRHSRGETPYSSMQMRVWNEVSTLFLVAIVFLVILKDTLHLVYSLLGLVIFAGVLMTAIWVYKKLRSKKT